MKNSKYRHVVNSSSKTGEQRFLSRVPLTAIVITLLILICMGMIYYFHWIRGIEIVFTHFFYLPILLAGFFWKRQGAWIGVFLGALLLTSHFLSGLDTPLKEDFLRAVMFVVVGLTVGVLREQALRSERALAEAKDYTDNIIKSMIDTLLVVDPDARIKTINRATSDLLGYKETELIGQPVATIFAEEEEEEEEEEEASIFKGTRLKRLIEEGTVRDYDMKYRTKKGEVIPVSFSGAVMRDKEGELVGIVGIARDMREIKRLMQKEKELAAAAAAADAEKKRAEELEKAYTALREAQAKLIQSEKLATVGRLAAGVAHEINNPLASVLLGLGKISGMTKKQIGVIPDSKVYLRTLEMMERGINRSKRIVAGLLAFARPTKLQLAPTNINEVIEETLESLEDQVKTLTVRVVKDFAHLPTIKADGQQLSQVFNNLIINACEAMSKGGQLRITTRLQKQKPMTEALGEAMGKEGKTVEIEFRDTGKGISEEDMLRIFDPFFTTKETDKGVGLGLSISYGIIEEHRGTIEIRSQKGKGSTFIIRLPAKI